MREIRLRSETIDVTVHECAVLCRIGLIAWQQEAFAYVVRSEIGKDWTHIEAALETLRDNRETI